MPALAAALLGLPTAAGATVFTTRPQALAEAFPGARIEQRSYVLKDAEAQSVQRRAGVKLASRVASAYLAWHGDTLAGTAFFDSRIVRTMPGVFMVVVTPDSVVERVEVIALHEPPDYHPPARWLRLFGGHRLDERLWPRRDIRNLAGATLSARAVTESVRLALAYYETLVAPALPPARGRPEVR